MFASSYSNRSGGKGVSASDDSHMLRVTHATGDPADEVRASLAQLTARAQRLITNSDDERLLRNGVGLFEASRRGAEEARMQSAKCQATGDSYTPASQASVELFMAQNLGFDAQAQQRLLQQLQQRQSQLAADLRPTDPPVASLSRLSDGAGGLNSISDVDAVVLELKNRTLLRVQGAVHRLQTSMMRDQVNTLFKAAWQPYNVGMADDFEGLSLEPLRDGAIAASTVERATSTVSGAVDRSFTQGGGASMIDLLTSGSAAATQLNAKVAAFANIVLEYPTSQWVSYFAAYAMDQAVNGGDELAVLWATMEQILEPIQRHGSSATTLLYVASSRSVMERKALSRLLTRTMKMDPARFEEVANMPAEHLLDVVARSSNTPNSWVHIFVAMRSGRYDVAKLAAQETGIAAVVAALEKVAAAPVTTRNHVPPALELQEAYTDATTRQDPYRQAVLFLLLVGRTGEAPAVVQRSMMELCQRVASSLEDTLWLRLCCIRGVEQSAQVPPVQSLAAMQKDILDDLHDLVVVAQGSVPRLTSFLIHALMPSTGFRMMLENSYTYIDGLHMALCFNANDLLLKSCAISAAEAPVDLGRHVSRYCTTVLLLSVDHRQRRAPVSGAALFAYFYKTGFNEAFVEFALKDHVCARLMGPRGLSPGSDIALFRGGGSAALAEELLKALLQVAEAAAARNQIATAIHVLTALAVVAQKSSRPSLRQNAIRRAVQIISPAIAQVLHLPPYSTVAEDIILQAVQLRHLMADDAALIDEDNGGVSRWDYAAFNALCAMADVYAAAAKENVELVISSFLQLPLVPPTSSSSAASEAGMKRYIQAYCNGPSSVVLAMEAVIPLFFQAVMQLMQRYTASPSSSATDDRESSGAALRQQVAVVCIWLHQCCTQMGIEYPSAAAQYESLYMS